jgi:hypothetical protein
LTAIVTSESEESLRKNINLSFSLMCKVDGLRPLSVTEMMWLLLSGGIVEGNGSASEASWLGRKHNTLTRMIEGR